MPDRAQARTRRKRKADEDAEAADAGAAEAIANTRQDVVAAAAQCSLCVEALGDGLSTLAHATAALPLRFADAAGRLPSAFADMLDGFSTAGREGVGLSAMLRSRVKWIEAAAEAAKMSGEQLEAYADVITACISSGDSAALVGLWGVVWASCVCVCVSCERLC